MGRLNGAGFGPALSRLGALTRPDWEEAAPDLSHLTEVGARQIRVGEIWQPSAFRTFVEAPRG
jgi:hypothetical protein